MIRALTCIAASLLMVGVLYADDKKPEAKAEGGYDKSPDTVKKVNKDDPEGGKKVAKEGVKKDDPEAVKKEGKEFIKKENPEAGKKVAKEVVKKDDPEVVKKVGKEVVKKEDPEAKAKQFKEGIKKEGSKSEGGSQKGRVTKIGIDGGVVKLFLDDKAYVFPVTDNTFAVLKIEERDGEQVVLGIQLSNPSEGIKKGGEKNELSKKEPIKKEGEKKTSEKPQEKKPE